MSGRGGGGENVPASPGPRCVPLERAAAQAVNAGTLRAGCSVFLAPEVVVHGVGTGDLVVPLATVICALLKGSGGYGEGE